MVDKIKVQNETSTSQKFTNLQIVGDLSASTTCRRQLLGLRNLDHFQFLVN